MEVFFNFLFSMFVFLTFTLISFFTYPVTKTNAMAQISQIYFLKVNET